MKYIKTFSNHSEYEAAESGLILPNVSLCVNENEVHYNPYVDPCASEIVKTTYEMVDLGLPSGVKWANKNIGALTEADYGQYFQWGDIQGFTADQVSGGCKAFSWADYKYSNNGGSSAADMTKYQGTGTGKDGLVTLEATDDAAVANMGGSWRMPTETEFKELLNIANCTKAWTSITVGDVTVDGYLFTSVRNSNTLFFPAAGNCYNGSVNSVGSGGGYWSSSLCTSNIALSSHLDFFNGYYVMFNDYRCFGFAVRGVVGQ